MKPLPLPLVALALVAGLCLTIAIYLVLTEPGRQRERANLEAASQIAAEGQTAAGRDAVATVSANAAHAAEIDRQTQENRDVILKAPGADVQLDPGLDTATRRAICMRASAKRDPACVALLNPRSN
jgi:hypothetical protein